MIILYFILALLKSFNWQGPYHQSRSFFYFLSFCDFFNLALDKEKIFRHRMSYTVTRIKVSIKNFKQKFLEDFFYDGLTAKIPQKLITRLAIILDLLDGIADVSDLKGIKNFHKLKGDRKHCHSLHVSSNWCITFVWDDENVWDVRLEDYH
jgi:proteic killer suppression protein